jgi:hypothetical protein
MVFVGLGLAALGRAVAARDADEGLVAIALGSAVAAALVVGMFDAVLLLALPALLIWSALGALAGELPEGRSRSLSPALRPVLALLVLLAAGASVIRSGGQVVAMSLYESGGRGSLEKAARLDPGSYRIRVRLARAYTGRRDCEKRREQVEAAHSLFPEAELPVSARRCRR